MQHRELLIGISLGISASALVEAFNVKHGPILRWLLPVAIVLIFVGLFVTNS